LNSHTHKYDSTIKLFDTCPYALGYYGGGGAGDARNTAVYPSQFFKQIWAKFRPIWTKFE